MALVTGMRLGSYEVIREGGRALRLSACAWFLGATLTLMACATGSEPPAMQGTTTGAGMEIGFRAEAGPPRVGDNTFEVTVRKDGAQVADATVTAVLSMPAMPSMNMPEMRSTAALAAVGEGRYRGTGNLSMAGTWNIMVTVTRADEELGTHRLSIVVR